MFLERQKEKIENRKKNKDNSSDNSSHDYTETNSRSLSNYSNESENNEYDENEKLIRSNYFDDGFDSSKIIFNSSTNFYSSPIKDKEENMKNEQTFHIQIHSHNQIRNPLPLLPFNTKKENMNKSQYLDLIYNNIGYGVYQLLIIMITFLVISIEGMHFYVFGAMISPFEKYYNINEGHIELISSLMFIGVGIGSFSLSFINKHFCRVGIMNFTLLALISFNLIWAFTSNLIIVSILRFSMGIMIGIFIPLIVSILCEYLPTYLRGGVLTLVWIGFSFGQLIVCGNIKLINENFKSDHLLIENFIISLIPYQLFVFLLVFLFLKDSPKYLLVHGSFEEGTKIIESMLKRELTIEEKDLLKVEKGVLNEEKDSFSSFFNSEYSRICIIVCFIGYLGSSLIYGPMLLINIEINNDNHSSSQNLYKMVYIILVSGLGNPIGAVLTEIKFFGRRRSCAFTSLFGLIFAFIIVYNPSLKLSFSSFLCFCSLLHVNIFSSYLLELYPTKHRSIGVSFFYTSMRIGGFTSQFIFVMLYRLNPIFPYYAYGVYFLFTVILLYLLPYDTSDRAVE